MKGILLLNGEPYINSIPKNKGDIAVACDGAYLWAKDKVQIDKFIGDFDSLGFVPSGAIVYPETKDATDGELGIDYLLGKVKDIEIYGGGGGRDDHYLGNIQLLYKCFKLGVRCKMITNYSTIVLAENSFKDKAALNQLISVVPFTDTVHINKSEGFKYPLNDLKLCQGSTLGISNAASSEEISLSIKSGIALIIKNHLSIK